MCHENPLYTTVLVPRCWPNSGVTDWFDFHVVNMHLVCTDHGINTSLFFNAGVSLKFLCEPTRYSSLFRLGLGSQAPLCKIYQQWTHSHSIGQSCLSWAGAAWAQSPPQAEVLIGSQTPCNYLDWVLMRLTETWLIQTTFFLKVLILVPSSQKLGAAFPTMLAST